MLTVADLDAACAPLAHQLRLRGDIPAAELDAAVPALEAPASAWLSYHGQLHRWLAAPAAAADGAARETADATVLAALRRAPVPVAGSALAVHPKSLATLLHLVAIDRVIDSLTVLAAEAARPEADAATRDRLYAIAPLLARAIGLAVWVWTTPGPGLPFDPADPEPTVPEALLALGPDDLLAVHEAVQAVLARGAAVQALIDPTPADQGGTRPTWSALFHALGATLAVSPHELQVVRTFDEVLALLQLEGDRRTAADPEAGA